MAKTTTKEYQAEYYQKNKERLRGYKHEYYLTHVAEYVKRSQKFVAKRKALARKLSKTTSSAPANLPA